MDGLMMQDPLTLVHFFGRARKYFAATEIVSRRPDKSIQRSTYGDFHRRAQKLANALTRLGVKPGERVATLAWNHGRHLEAYFAIPLCGGVLHTLNPRLSVQDIAYIINHADDSVVIVDDVLWGLWERIRREVKPRHVIVWGHGQPAPGAASRSGQRPEPSRGRGSDADRRRAHRLARHPGSARLQSGQVGPEGAAHDDRRRIGRSAGDDRGLREAAWPPGHPRLGHERNVAHRHHLQAGSPRDPAARFRAVPPPGHAGDGGAVRRHSRRRRSRRSALGRQIDGRVARPRPVRSALLLPEPGGGRQIHDGRLVPHRRRGHHRSRGIRAHHRPLEGPDQERRGVDQLGRRRERPDGSSGRQGGGGGGGTAREMVGAARGLRRPQGRSEGERRRVARLARAALREVLAAGRVRVPAADPAHGDGKVPQRGTARPAQGLPAASRRESALLKASRCSGVSSTSGGRTARQDGSPVRAAKASLRPAISGKRSNAARTASISRCCSSVRSRKACAMALAFRLAVAVMHPAPPSRRLARRNFSLPTNTSNPGKARRIARVLSKSPELSLIPTTMPGYAFSRRPITGSGMPAWETWGMWYRYTRSLGSAARSMACAKLRKSPSSVRFL